MLRAIFQKEEGKNKSTIFLFLFSCNLVGHTHTYLVKTLDHGAEESPIIAITIEMDTVHHTEVSSRNQVKMNKIFETITFCRSIRIFFAPEN